VGLSRAPAEFCVRFMQPPEYELRRILILGTSVNSPQPTPQDAHLNALGYSPLISTLWGILISSIPVGKASGRSQMRVEAKLEELGLTLAEPPKVPPGVQVSFA
jgi:hypothetical protein